MEVEEVLKELQGMQGKWTTIKNKKILVADTRAGIDKMNGAKSYQIPTMYSGYQAWRAEVEQAIKEMVNLDAIKQHEEPPFYQESETDVKLPLQTEELEDDRPRKGFLAKIFGKSE